MMDKILQVEIKRPSGKFYFLGPMNNSVFGIKYEELGILGLGDSSTVSTLEDAVELFEKSLKNYLTDAQEVAWHTQPTAFVREGKYGVFCKLAKYHYTKASN